MSEYLTKEEIRRWRSSLERITLEEYAAKLGKVIQEEKHDDSLVDSVMFSSLNSAPSGSYAPKAEKIQSLALKSFAKEKEIKSLTEVKPAVPSAKAAESSNQKKKEAHKPKKSSRIEEEALNFSFKKPLTEREQLVFDHFLSCRNVIVYAKDLAEILDLPRDYVYKYIKNLRSKLNEDILQNADNGGYVLKV